MHLSSVLASCFLFFLFFPFFLFFLFFSPFRGDDLLCWTPWWFRTVCVSCALVCVQGLANMGAQICQKLAEEALSKHVPSSDWGQNFAEWASNQLTFAGLPSHDVPRTRQGLLSKTSPLWDMLLEAVSNRSALFQYQGGDQIDRTIARLSQANRKVGAWAHARTRKHVRICSGYTPTTRCPKGSRLRCPRGAPLPSHRCCETHPHSFCADSARGRRCQSCAPAVCFLRRRKPQGCPRQPQEDFDVDYLARGPGRCSCRPQVMHGRPVQIHEDLIQVLQQG